MGVSWLKIAVELVDEDDAWDDEAVDVGWGDGDAAVAADDDERFELVFVPFVPLLVESLLDLTVAVVVAVVVVVVVVESFGSSFILDTVIGVIVDWDDA